MTASNSTSPPWADSFDALWAAESLPTAQIAAADLVSVVLPGGSAVDLAAGQLIVRIRELGQPLATHTYRAYVIAVLMAIGTWIGAWQRAAGTNPHLASAGAREKAMAIDLSEFCRENVELLTDKDPEARSVMSLLVGAVWPVAAEADVLLARYAVETDPRVRACVAQALVRYVGRLDERQAGDLVRELDALLEDASRESLARASMELSGVWWTEQDRQRLATRISIPAARDVPLLWPAEEI